MERGAAGHNPGLEAAQRLGFLVGSCLCLILSAAFVAGIVRKAGGSPGLCPNGRVNPNDASMASLARLPGIGPTRAHAIVDFRIRLQQQGNLPAFRCAEDLAQVKGIGPATVDAIRPWLQFDSLSGPNDMPIRE